MILCGAVSKLAVGQDHLRGTVNKRQRDGVGDYLSSIRDSRWKIRGLSWAREVCYVGQEGSACARVDTIVVEG